MSLVVKLAEEPAANWRSQFERLGASLDTVQRNEIIKLHIHCDDPAAIVSACEKLGRIEQTTTQDMTADLVRSEDVASSIESVGPDRPGRARVLSDSSMSLPRELARELNVPRIENYVGIHGRMIRDSEIDLDALYTRMRNGASYTTAQASSQEVREFLDGHLESGHRSLYLAVGRSYTGTQDLVRRVAAEHPLGSNLTVLDTGAASGQQGLATLAVARRAHATDNADELIEYARGQIELCKEYIVIDDLKHLARSGRIGRVKAAFAGALSVKPIVGHGGNGAITWAKVRSHRAALEAIVDRVAKHPGNSSLLLMIEHTDNRDWALEVRDYLTRELPRDTEFILSPLSSTSTVHMGPGTWGVAVTRL